MRVSSFAHRRSGVASDGHACGFSGGASSASSGRQPQKLCLMSGACLELRLCNRRSALCCSRRHNADIASSGAAAEAGER